MVLKSNHGTIRELAGREAVGLYYKIVDEAKNLKQEVADKMLNFENTCEEDWKIIDNEISRTLEAFAYLNQTGGLNEEQKRLIQKLESQKKYLAETILPYFEQRDIKKAA